MGMSRHRPCPKRAVMLRLWIERMAPVAAVCLMMLGGGLLLMRPPGAGFRDCVVRYGQARTAADTLVVDRRWADGKRMLLVSTEGEPRLRRGARVTCGWAPRNGKLELYRPRGEVEG